MEMTCSSDLAADEVHACPGFFTAPMIETFLLWNSLMKMVTWAFFR